MFDFDRAAQRGNVTEIGADARADAIHAMATGTICFAFEERLASRGIAVACDGTARGGEGAQVSHHDFGLEILQIVRRHAGPRNAILDDLDQGVFGIRLAKPAVAQVDARYLIAFRPVAKDAIRAE